MCDILHLKTIYLCCWFVCAAFDLGTSRVMTNSSESEAFYVNVKISNGVVRGRQKISNGFTKLKYFSFLGIPYAKPPIRELRFKDPRPAERWAGVRDALQEGPNSPQKHILFYNEVGDEDCLYLNVFSKKLSTKPADLKPVMVYIHAGGFTSGSGDTDVYGPDFLIEHDIVLVTFNYRLGALGFLSLENNKLPGNFGLKDQVLALKWVKKNIKQFGGDPKSVTIFGISAGGASVQYHLLSPLSKGLFHRAIIQSGSSMNPWAYDNNPKNITLRLAKYLGYEDDIEDSDKLVAFFRKVPTFTLINAQYAVLTEKEKLHTMKFSIRPCVEKKGPGKQFITQTPREILESGNFTKVPLIIGCTSKEGNLELEVVDLNDPKEFEKINNDLDLVTPVDMKIPVGEVDKVGKEIMKFFFDGKPLSWANVDNFVDLFGDHTFYLALADTLNLTLKKSVPRVYSYVITYQNIRSFLRFLASKKYPDLAVQGTPHGDDIPLLFKQGQPFPEIKIPRNDEAVIKKMTKLWATFAKTGNPNYKGLEATWEPTRVSNLKYYEIGNEFKMVSGRVNEKRLRFWDDLYTKYKHAF